MEQHEKLQSILTGGVYHTAWDLQRAKRNSPQQIFRDIICQGLFLFVLGFNHWLTSLSADWTDTFAPYKIHSRTQFFTSPYSQGSHSNVGTRSKIESTCPVDIVFWFCSLKRVCLFFFAGILLPVHWYHPFWLQYSTKIWKLQDVKLYKMHIFSLYKMQKSPWTDWQQHKRMIK